MMCQHVQAPESAGWRRERAVCDVSEPSRIPRPFGIGRVRVPRAQVYMYVMSVNALEINKTRYLHAFQGETAPGGPTFTN